MPTDSKLDAIVGQILVVTDVLVVVRDRIEIRIVLRDAPSLILEDAIGRCRHRTERLLSADPKRRTSC